MTLDLQRWLRGERALLSKHAKVAKAIDYLLSPDHWAGFTEFLRDGRVCLTTDVVEQPLSQPFCGFGGLSLQASTIWA
jgi:hypothetical protein